MPLDHPQCVNDLPVVVLIIASNQKPIADHDLGTRHYPNSTSQSAYMAVDELHQFG